MIRRLASSALTGALLTIAGCSSPSGGDATPRLLVFGIDGGDWDRAIPLIRSSAFVRFSLLTRRAGCIRGEKAVRVRLFRPDSGLNQVMANTSFQGAGLAAQLFTRE